MENEFITLSYYDAITNKELFDEARIDRYLKDFQKNKGTLQKNLRDIVESTYQLVYQDVVWNGRGKKRTLKIGKKHPIAQVSVHKNTQYSTVLSASLMILLLNDKINDNKNISKLLMIKPKWLKEAGIIDNNFSFINRDDVNTILEMVLLRYVGEDNSDIISFAIWFYKKNTRMFLNEEFSKTEIFLKNNYNLNMISEDRWNLNDEKIIDLYADKLVQVINSRQRYLTKKNIEYEMFTAWKEYNNNDMKIIPGDLKSLILDYPINQIKRNINRSIHISEVGLGAAERISFTIEDKLTKGEYEKIDAINDSSTIKKRFYKLTKRIRPSEEEKIAVEIPLSEFCVENNFDKQRLIYDNSSVESKHYRFLEKSILENLGYDKKYALMLFEESSLEEAIINTPFIIVNSIKNELLTVPISLFNKGRVLNGKEEKYAKHILKNMLTEQSQKLQNEKMDDYLKKIVKRNKSWINIDNQKHLDESIKDLLYILLLAIDEFISDNKNLPNHTIIDPSVLKKEAEKIILFENEILKENIDSALNKETIQHHISILEDRKMVLSEDEILQLISLKNQRLEAIRARDILENIKKQVDKTLIL